MYGFGLVSATGKCSGTNSVSDETLHRNAETVKLAQTVTLSVWQLGCWL